MAAENEYTDMLNIEDTEDRCKNSDKTWKRAFITTLVLNFLALVSLLGLHVYSQVRPSDPGPDPDSLSEDLCVPCQEETALFDYRVRTDTNKFLCCYNNTDIQRAVKIILKEERRYNTEFDDGKNYIPLNGVDEDTDQLTWWKSRPSAAHLHLDITENNNIEWKANPDFVTSFKSDDIKVNGTNIEVSERGMYFIYSTISVEFSKMDEGQSSKDQTFYHNIQKGNINLPNTGQHIQMMRKYGGIPAQETDRLYTSFLCGALFLKKGDTLASEFVEPPLIYKFPYANYFGIFKL